MKCDKKDLLLYVVTDRSWSAGTTLYHQVEEALQGGATFVQLREKELGKDAFFKEAVEIQALCKRYRVPFVINDNVELALSINSDGVHVGQSDTKADDVRIKLGSDKIIGVSAQTVEQALLAQKNGADYLGVGAVFPTDSKDDAKDVSMDTLRAICEAVDIPVIAIGGINKNNVKELFGTGICGIAVISAILAQSDIKAATAELKKLTIETVPSFESLDSNSMKTALTIAGSDSSGGAGIQADIKTMMANGTYAMSAITALTAQNTTGVTAILNVTPEFLSQELDSVFTDIYPDAVKIGMVPEKELIEVIAHKLKQYQAKNIVVDPVMVATSGARLISTEAIEVLKNSLFPLASILTPNIPEAEELTGLHIESPEDMISVAKLISNQYHCAVLLKGGHKFNEANDLLFRNGSYRWFYGERIQNSNTHGTGCTLSSAIASNLAKGFDLDTSVERAKQYIRGALLAMLNLGKKSGPLAHGFACTNEFTSEP